MDEKLIPTIGIINSEIINDITATMDIQQHIIETRQLKTKPYVLNASKRYRDKNPEKMKEYREKYKQEKAELLINSLSNDNLTKFQLIKKITRLEESFKTLELKYKELENKNK